MHCVTKRSSKQLSGIVIACIVQHYRQAVLCKTMVPLCVWQRQQEIGAVDIHTYQVGMQISQAETSCKH